MKLLDSTGSELASGAQYYASGWKTFGSGSTTTNMELLPLTYTFRVSYGGASQEKSQNVETDPNVIFQTTKVTLWFSGSIQYYASGWRTFMKPSMELLPLTYTFRFVDAGHPAKEKSLSISGILFERTVTAATL